MVVALRLGVAKLVAVANGVPPVDAEYHRTVFPFVPKFAVNVTDPVPHRLPLVAVGTEGIALTVKVTACLGVLSQVVVVL